MKLYKAAYVIADDNHDDGGPNWVPDTGAFPEPEGWDEHCQQTWGEWHAFFPPSDRKLYRSRSSAQARVDLINRWFGDGAAELLEAEVEFEPVAVANARRATIRKQSRIAKLRAEIARLEGE